MEKKLEEMGKGFSTMVGKQKITFDKESHLRDFVAAYSNRVTRVSVLDGFEFKDSGLGDMAIGEWGFFWDGNDHNGISYHLGKCTGSCHEDQRGSCWEHFLAFDEFMAQLIHKDPRAFLIKAAERYSHHYGAGELNEACEAALDLAWEAEEDKEPVEEEEGPVIAPGSTMLSARSDEDKKKARALIGSTVLDPNGVEAILSNVTFRDTGLVLTDVFEVYYKDRGVNDTVPHIHVLPSPPLPGFTPPAPMASHGVPEPAKRKRELSVYFPEDVKTAMKYVATGVETVEGVPVTLNGIRTPEFSKDAPGLRPSFSVVDCSGAGFYVERIRIDEEEAAPAPMDGPAPFNPWPSDPQATETKD